MPSLRLPGLLLLLLLAPGLVLAQDVPLSPKGFFPPEEFAARRARVMDAIGPDAVAVVQGAAAPHSSARFRQSNQFFYLSGVRTPHAYLLIDARSRRTTLYLPHLNAQRAGTDGEVLTADDPEAARAATGVDAVYGSDLLAEHLARYARRDAPVLYTPFSPAEGPAASRDGELRVVADVAGDAWDGRPSREGHLVHLLRTRFPALSVRDLSPVLDRLRLIKSPREQAMIRWASRLSGEALMEAMRSTEPGVLEFEIDAAARFIFFRHGAQGEGYAAIVATGKNAYYPHHRASDGVMQAGELVLMDYSPDVEYYRTDLTRMWPVSGRFSDVQRELYGFYLTCYRAVLERITVGKSAAEIMREALPVMQEALATTTFSKPRYREAAEDFVRSYEGRSGREDTYLGHWVGMSTHDPGSHTGPLEPGMVFTIEPALRVPEEQIYIRLEDLFIITEDGAEVVSDFVPMEIDAIEALMQEPGLLQQYPRLN